MSLRRSLISAMRVRASLRALDRIAVAFEEQNRLLAKLVEAVTPKVLEVSAPPTDSVSYLDADELADVLAYQERMLKQTGHEPTDEETIEWLAERAQSRSILDEVEGQR